MLKNLLQFIPQDVCLSCDGCCRFKDQSSLWRPKVTQDEIDECHRGELGPPELNFMDQLDPNHYIKAIECRGQSQCTFFHQRDHICDIYEYRPFECRLYPFLLMNKDDGVVVGLHLSCPYVLENRQAEAFQDHIRNLQRHFQQREVLDFIRRNRSLSRDYSEYDQEIEYLFALSL